MRRHVSAVLLVLFGSCLAASTAFAAEEPAHNDLAEINATLKEIARTLKQQVQTQKADLILKRLTLAMTQLANAQERLNRIDKEISASEGQRSEFETMLANAQKQPPTGDPAAAAAKINSIKSWLQSIRDQLSALSQERVSAENEVGSLKRDVQDWQGLLDKTITAGS